MDTDPTDLTLIRQHADLVARDRIIGLEAENARLTERLDWYRRQHERLQARVAELETGGPSGAGWRRLVRRRR